MKALVFPLGFGGYELDVNIENLGYSLVKGNKEVLSTDPKEGFWQTSEREVVGRRRRID